MRVKWPDMRVGDIVECPKCGCDVTLTESRLKIKRRLCKECHRANTKAWIANNFEKARASIHRYQSKRVGDLSKHTISNKAHNARNPEKQKARKAIDNGRRNGTIFPEPCEVCGSVTNIHAHHSDYTKPLDVNWLCAEHHTQQHRLMAENKALTATIAQLKDEITSQRAVIVDQQADMRVLSEAVLDPHLHWSKKNAACVIAVKLWRGRDAHRTDSTDRVVDKRGIIYF